MVVSMLRILNVSVIQALLFVHVVQSQRYTDAAVVTLGAADDTPSSSSIIAGGTDCVSPPHPGSPKCRIWRSQYYFNSRTQSCETFIYSGCSGNGNRFDTRFMCEEVCIRRAAAAASSSSSDSSPTTADRYKRQKAGFKLPTDYNLEEDLKYYGAADPNFYQRPADEDDRRAGFKLPVSSASAGVAVVNNNALNSNRRPSAAVAVAAGPVTQHQQQNYNNNNNGSGLRVLLNRVLSNLRG